MKKLVSITTILIVSLGLFSFNTFAQDVKAKSILEKVSTEFKTAKTMQADFALAVKDRNGKERNAQKGKFYMKGDKYKVDLGAQQIICDGANIWTYMPANKEVQVSKFVANEQTISPAKLFSGSYETEYTYTYAGAKTIDGKTVDVIVLSPKKAQSFNKVELHVDNKANMIVGGNIFEKNGSSYTYKISNVKVNPTLSDQEFTFDSKKYPGVEVIDLR